MQGSQAPGDFHLLLCQSHKQDKSAAPQLPSVQQAKSRLLHRNLQVDHGNHYDI